MLSSRNWVKLKEDNRGTFILIAHSQQLFRFIVFQVSGHGALSLGRRVLRLLSDLQWAQKLVLICPVKHLRIPTHVWWVLTFKYRLFSIRFYVGREITNVFFLRFHHDDPSAVHQLQAEVCCSSALAYVDVQGPQHLHRRHLRLCHQDADHVPHRMLQGRHCLLHLPLSALHLQGKLINDATYENLAKELQMPFICHE